MAVHRSTGPRLTATTALLLLVVACGSAGTSGPEDLAAGSGTLADPTSTAAPGEGQSGEDTATGVPSTPRPEGTDPEEPRPPARPQGSATIAGPGIGKGDEPTLSADSPTGCLRVMLSDEFAEDARVEAVSVGPAGVFGLEDRACDEEGKAPLCPGFVFRAAEEEPACSVGLRWSPRSGEPDGLLSMSFSATCQTREGACAVVEPGTPVTFTSGLALRALVFDQEEGTGDGNGGEETPEGGGGTGEGQPDDEQPGDGQPESSPGDGQPDGSPGDDPGDDVDST
jgi:hypothetical protein